MAYFILKQEDEEAAITQAKKDAEK